MKVLSTNISALVVPTALYKFKLIRSVFELESGNQNVDGQMHGHTVALTGTNFNSNIAWVASYHPVQFQTTMLIDRYIY